MSSEHDEVDFVLSCLQADGSEDEGDGNYRPDAG
jgi:hypothetical protein